MSLWRLKTPLVRQPSNSANNALKGAYVKAKKTIGEFCPLCAVAIATHDPERVIRGGIAYHHGCIKKTMQPIKRTVQQWFRFEQGLTVN
jgi:hypothetical protein